MNANLAEYHVPVNKSVRGLPVTLDKVLWLAENRPSRPGERVRATPPKG